MNRACLPLRRTGTAVVALWGLLLAFVALACGGGSVAVVPTPTPDSPLRLELSLYVDGLQRPVDLQDSADGTGRLFVVEQGGVIRIIQDAALRPGSFLDIRSRVASGGEKGLLGLAFHPRFPQNRRFYVNYTRSVNDQLQSVVAEYQASAVDPNVADAAETVLVTVDQPFGNHNGGQLAFGPDGYLYIALGDGGSGGDPPDNGQSLGTLLGKLLRIDVDSSRPYAVPADGPFVDQPGADEIWAYGLRNPWRFLFDRSTGRLFLADVGQNDFEEVDLITRGGNYGWNIMEGGHCYPPPSTDCNTTGMVSRIAEYGHDEGQSVTGGYVYRGPLIERLRGTYVFGDFITGKIRSLKETSGGEWSRDLRLDTEINISSFGQNQASELYVLDYNGAIYRLREVSTA